jgi:TonB family protein
MVSLLFHAGAIAAVIIVATLNVRQDPVVIEVEIVENPPPLAEPLVPPAKPAPPVPVPDVEMIRKVERVARPFQAEAQILNRRPRDPNAVIDRGIPTLTFAIPMEATVDGGSGFEVIAVVGADPGMHGDPSIVSLAAVEYADTWEITVEPEPLNDRDFKPVYPPGAKARGLEAAVEVEVLVDSSGAVAGTRVLVSGGNPFSTSALEYCRKLRFKPALANHLPVASRIVWVVDYRFGNR